LPAGNDPPHERRSLGKGRMEAFSDGVFGVAITLLVVDLAIHPPGTALQQVVRAWPSFVAYVISFLTIGTAWLGHSGLSDRLAKTDPVFLRINLLLLLVVVFLPFPTRLVAESLHETSRERVFITMYGLTLLTIRLLGFALAAYARRGGLYSPHEDDAESHSDRRKLVPVLIGYVIAILIGLALPQVAVALYFGVAVYAIVPFRQVARLIFGQS
jgi:uncharacterized membrane protein